MAQIKGKTIKSILPIEGYGLCGGLLRGCIMTFTDGTHVRMEILPERKWEPKGDKVLSISKIFGSPQAPQAPQAPADRISETVFENGDLCCGIHL